MHLLCLVAIITYRFLFDRAAHEAFCKFYRRVEQGISTMGKLMCVYIKYEQVNLKYNQSSK